jgi:VanZ family protein
MSILPTDLYGEQPDFYFKGMDKIIHAIMYCILSLLILNVYLKKYTLRFLPISLLLIFTWFYSIIMELIQYYIVEYRSGDIKDALANLTGIAMAFFIVLLVKKIRY